MYNASTYAVNYCIIGLSWIGFDDVEAIRAKIAYVKCISQEEEATCESDTICRFLLWLRVIPFVGLLKISEDGTVELLTDEAEGVKFKLTDCVDVAQNGMLYFTDASHKYSLKDFTSDILGGRPHGRLTSYNPTTKETEVLVHNLYFANGVAVSPDQNFVVLCETVMRRCRKYYLQGSKKGSVENFIDHLPGFPDNIRYDGEGQYWIALATEVTPFWDLALRYPFIRKVLAIVKRCAAGRPHMEKNAGVLAVNLNGEPTAHYSDPELFLISSGIKIGNYLYCGSIVNPYIIRLDVHQHPALPTT
ncbi:unnamed protein product [Prunus armeniaca]|uniref:Strictosidine synthase conserved region domain-containing protein n=1 Tax=Prunus armeniaca TaxID=36596 RepID=A0A6J5Y1K8_PRUAR|nr:unnamed protein product [Prunus armeniaca]